MSNHLDNIFWIIRSVDERTTGACANLIRQFVPNDRLIIIKEQPFSAAIKKTFQLGATSGAKWTACIDADVLIYKKGILQLIDVADSVDDDVYYVQGLTIDKLLPIIRSPGNGLYRNKWVKKAIQFIPEDGTSVRPETTTMKGMTARGHKCYRTDIIVGLHDYEQWYEDIYRKSFLHAVKHANAFPMVEEYWKKHRKADKDFEVALLGARIGKTYNDKIYVNKSYQQEEWGIIKELKNIREKKPLDDGAFTETDIEEKINAFERHEELQQLKFPQFSQRYYVHSRTPLYRKIPRFTVKLAGKVFVKAGNLIKRYAERL